MHENDCVLVNNCGLAHIAQAGQVKLEKEAFCIFGEGAG